MRYLSDIRKCDPPHIELFEVISSLIGFDSIGYY
jgi:hypothetical protein